MAVDRIVRDQAQWDIGIRKKGPPDEKGAVAWTTVTECFDVSVEINLTRIMKRLAAKAARNRTGRATAMNGSVVARAKKVA